MIIGLRLSILRVVVCVVNRIRIVFFMRNELFIVCLVFFVFSRVFCKYVLLYKNNRIVKYKCIYSV